VSLLFCVAVGRSRQQAIVIRKGQTRPANDSRATSAGYVRRVTLPGLRRSRKRSRPHGTISAVQPTAPAIYSATPGQFYRDQLSQLTTSSQAVDGLRAWFDNAESVE
jgi:hypothetical protein